MRQALSYRRLTKSVLGVVSIHCDPAPTPTGFLEIASDDFSILQALGSACFGLLRAMKNDNERRDDAGNANDC